MFTKILAWFSPDGAHQRGKCVVDETDEAANTQATKIPPLESKSISGPPNGRKPSSIKSWCDRLKAKCGSRTNPGPDSSATVDEKKNTTIRRHVDNVDNNDTNNDTNNDNDSKEERNDDDEDEHPRCDWKTIDAIPASSYEKLVSHTCCFSGPLREARRLAYRKGTYNAASFVGLRTHNVIDMYIVRVPGHATIEHWTAQDAYMMEREVQIIEYIRENTSAPVPQICTYSTNFNNMLGHPFIMMTRLPGKSAYSIWFDEFDGEGDELGFRNGDIPSAAVEKKRITFLRSLASSMAEINTLSFDFIGMPIVPVDGSVGTSVGPMYHWDNTGRDVSIQRPILPSTQDLVSTRPTISSVVHSKDPDLHRGALKLLDIIFTCSVFDPFEAWETFTLHHSDLDLQNILVDSTGAVTGIIDWDRCVAAPRSIGASSAPLFLQKDWMPSYLSSLSNCPYMAFSTHRYRHIYAAALLEHGCADARFTTKSAMYQAGVMALYDEGGDVMDFLRKVLRAIPQFRANVEECLIALGKGWPAGERILKREVEVLFEPEMPDVDVLKEVEGDIVVAEWMMDFEYGDEGEDAYGQT